MVVPLAGYQRWVWGKDDRFDLRWVKCKVSVRQLDFPADTYGSVNVY